MKSLSKHITESLDTIYINENVLSVFKDNPNDRTDAYALSNLIYSKGVKALARKKFKLNDLGDVVELGKHMKALPDKLQLGTIMITKQLGWRTFDVRLVISDSYALESFELGKPLKDTFNKSIYGDISSQLKKAEAAIARGYTNPVMPDIFRIDELSFGAFFEPTKSSIDIVKKYGFAAKDYQSSARAYNDKHGIKKTYN